MSFWSSVGNVFKTVGGAVGSLFGGASGIASAAMNAAGGVVSNAQQFDYQKKLQSQSFGYNKDLANQSFGYNKQLQQQSYELSKQLQQYQNDYTTKMASSAHQIEVEDLRKAGLNPILSATGGNGASFSTGGATVGNSSVGVGSVGTGQAGSPDLGDLGSTAIQLGQQIKLNNSLLKVQKAQEHNYEADSYLKGNLANTESEKFATQVALTKDLENQIKNRDATTSAQVRYYDSLGAAALQNSLANYMTSKSVSAKNYQDININKPREEYYNSGFGKRTGYSNEFWKSVPFIGKYGFR